MVRHHPNVGSHWQGHPQCPLCMPHRPQSHPRQVGAEEERAGRTETQSRGNGENSQVRSRVQGNERKVLRSAVHRRTYRRESVGEREGTPTGG